MTGLKDWGSISMSLPTRERGLKQPLLRLPRNHLTSLPTRERGLKLRNGRAGLAQHMSLPTRERGLKHDMSMAALDKARRRSLRGSVD